MSNINNCTNPSEIQDRVPDTYWELDTYLLTVKRESGSRDGKESMHSLVYPLDIGGVVK